MSAQRSQHGPMRAQLLALLAGLLEHNGFGSLTVDVRLLRRGQKEVIVRCGKEYRYVVDFSPGGEMQALSGSSDDAGSWMSSAKTETPPAAFEGKGPRLASTKEIV